ncbi:glycosyltransferase [Sphingomonas sp. PP-CE-1G-424]|uniref:glycosyltransferase n=1 Tax=Sphingomonas sp. PP-CE-1G-424 TaxID=2135658 RepID=UPI0010547F0C|nr:glycosyltransferase [Sphingomonas sp. PP-CE-1G-424]TCP72949.1 glycosyltransferase involved in cell wall biosynthesis [Sphingomonas sp. PP-CE-1G-424]
MTETAASGRRALRVFYIGAGDPVDPRSGMDVVARAHIAELAASRAIDLTGVFTTLPADTPPPAFGGVGGYRADTKTPSKARKLAHLLSGKLLMSIGFVSTPARRAIRAGLAAKPDLIVVDHIQALANVSLWRLVLGRTPFVFIAHNVTPDTLVDGARLRKSRAAAAFLRVEAVQAWLIEALLLRRAARTVFISDSDARHYRSLTGAKGVALCPVIERAPVSAVKAIAPPSNDINHRRVLFIGSPGFPPNRAAIDWITRSLAPALLALDAPAIVTFIGKGTRDHIGTPAANVETLGFVADDEMERLLGACLCMLSPVVHGSGLKIKMLEAFAAGAPVMATPLSLQGFEFMGVPALLDLDRPETAARHILGLAQDPAAVEAARTHVRERWAAHSRQREGALVDTLIGARAGRAG